MRNRPRFLALLFAISISLSLLSPIEATALNFNSAPARTWGYVLAGDQPSTTSLLSAQRAPHIEGEKKSDWIVDYVGLPDEAQAAVQYAIDIWSRNFTSKVPINVKAIWENNSNPLILGTARPGFYFNSFPGAPDDTLWYPSALANSLAGKDLNPSQEEMVLRVNSTPLWYFDLDGKPGPDSYDLVSVILHEIAHGLGFLSNAEYDRFFGTGYMFQPTPYDAYVQIPDGRTFTDFCSRSADLGRAMTGPLYWSGQSAIAANNNAKPKLYTPNPYQEGSSITHLDEETFGISPRDSVMTPELNPGEVFTSPGPIALAMIDDMLRKPPMGTASGVPAKPINVKALVGDRYALITFDTSNCTRVEKVTGYQVKIMPGGEIRKFSSSPIKITGLKNGKSYSFTIAAENDKGISEEVQSNSIKPESTPTPKVIDPYSKVSFLTATQFLGKPTVYYGDMNTQTLKSATFTSGKWKIATIRKGINVGPLSVCKSGSGKSEILHLFYADLERKDLIYSRLKAGKWSSETVDGNGPDVQDYRESSRRETASDVSVTNACAVTSAGLQVFYRDESQGILLGAVQTKNGWVYEIVDGDRKDSGRTTGDVAFHLAATTSGGTVYLLYDSVLSLNSNRVVTEGEVRLAKRSTVFSEDWDYTTLDGPDFGTPVAGYAVAIQSSRGEVSGAWLAAQGHSIIEPTKIKFAPLVNDLSSVALTTENYGNPSQLLLLTSTKLIYDCKKRVCLTNIKFSSNSLFIGKILTNWKGFILSIGEATDLILLSNHALCVLPVN